MSSFGINRPSSNQPLVTGSQNLGKDGGGGNSGYMNMRKRKKGSRQNEDDNSVFLEEEIEDSFEKAGKKKEQKGGGKILGAISNFIKDNAPVYPAIKDTFIKSEEIEAENEDGDYSSYNLRLHQTVDPLEDDEYEVVDDEYYDDIDI